ncbi:hypothetical protein V8C42DRAFT_337819, partial [Trichoderma barbatum]
MKANEGKPITTPSPKFLLSHNEKLRGLLSSNPLGVRSESSLSMASGLGLSVHFKVPSRFEQKYFVPNSIVGRGICCSAWIWLTLVATSSILLDAFATISKAVAAMSVALAVTTGSCTAAVAVVSTTELLALSI